MFGDPSLVGFKKSCGKTDRQTDKQTAVKTVPPPLPSVWIITTQAGLHKQFTVRLSSL